MSRITKFTIIGAAIGIVVMCLWTFLSTLFGIVQEPAIIQWLQKPVGEIKTCQLLAAILIMAILVRG